MQYKHVSPASVAVILAAGDIAITLLEVPTGRCADRFGHRCSLIVGSVIQTAGMLLCWLGEGIPGLLLASLCVALGDTFRSGADQALLYRSCHATGQTERFQRIEATTCSLELIALVVMMLVGGTIVTTWGFAVAWLLETVLVASGVVLAMTMVEPPVAEPRDETQPAGPSGETAGWALLRLIVPAALIAGAAQAAAFIAQTDMHATPAQLTILVSAITLVEAAGAALARYLRPDPATQYALLVLGTVCVISMVLMPDVLRAGVVGLSFLMGAAEPLRATAIQRLVTRRRAEAASWASAIDGGVRTVSLLVAGGLSRRRRRT